MVLNDLFFLNSSAPKPSSKSVAGAWSVVQNNQEAVGAHYSFCLQYL